MSSTAQQETMDKKILIEQVDILFSHTKNIAISSSLGALILLYAQWNNIAHNTILLWLGLMLSATLIRLLTDYSYNKANISIHNVEAWKRRYIFSSIPTHFGWGMGAILMFPLDSPVHQVTTISVLMASVAFGASSLSALRLPVFIFIPSVMLPLMISATLASDHIAETLIPLFAIYTVFLLRIAHQNYERTLKSITLLLESKNREQQIRKAEKKVRASEARLAEAERIGHMGSWEWDIALNKMYWSTETYQLLGFPKKNITPSFELLMEAIHPDDRGMIQDNISNALENNVACSQICQLQLRNGDKRIIRGVAKPLVNKQNKAVRLFGIIQDITEQQTLEEQLLQSQKMESIGTLVGGIAHDFNNMLGSMLGQIYLAKREVKNDDKLLGRLVNIEHTSNRAAKMVSHLLIFARKDAIALHPMDFTEFLRKSTPLNAAGITENIEVKHHITKKSLSIKGDATQLQQVLLNLLNNASHALQSQDKPFIIVSLEDFHADKAFLREHPSLKTKYLAHLSVHDNGTGMSEESIQHIFEPFYTTKEPGQGTGLGLSMVFGAIQSHGGIITATSDTNSGTTIHIYLPLLEQPSDHMVQSSSLQSIPSFTTGGETILLTDDEDILRESIQEALESLGYKVLTAKNGAEAIEVFNQHKESISLLITDVIMPKMSGHEAAKIIRQSSPNLPIIFISGYDPSQISKLELENSILLGKPVGIDVLDKHIQQLLPPTPTP